MSNELIVKIKNGTDLANVLEGAIRQANGYQNGIDKYTSLRDALIAIINILRRLT